MRGTTRLTEIAQGIKTAANDTDPLAVFTGGLCLLWPIDRYLPAHWTFLGLLFMMASVIGYPLGYLVGRRLVEMLLEAVPPDRKYERPEEPVVAKA